MGSIADDHKNNMLLGYSGSSATFFRRVYVTGRLASDTHQHHGDGKQVFAGLNSQVNYQRVPLWLSLGRLQLSDA